MLGILDFAFREFQNFAFRNSRFIAKNSKFLLGNLKFLSTSNSSTCVLVWLIALAAAQGYNTKFIQSRCLKAISSTQQVAQQNSA